MKKVRKYFAVLLALVMTLTAIPLSGLTASAANSGDFEYEVLSETDKTCEITGYTGNATDLTIPSELDGYTVTSIGGSAFCRCTSLTSINLPYGITDIGSWAFSECSQLASITLPETVTHIGESAFVATAYSLNPDNRDSDGALYIGSHLIELDMNYSGFYTVKPGTKTVADYAFFACKSLTGVALPDGIAQIGAGMFSVCQSLSEIEIPNSVTYIGDHAFEYCEALKEIQIPDSVQFIGSSALKECTSLENITIPNSVTSIGDGAFYNCTSLTSIPIPDSVTSIGTNAFLYTAYYNDEANWEDGVLYIGNHCIDSKQDIQGSITIKPGTKTLADIAFSDCTSLTSITIPESVTSFGESVFFNCENITIYGYAGSSAETYAAENDIPFVALTSVSDEETGITIESTASGELPENSELAVEQIESSDTGVTYSIVLTQNGESVQPTGEVTVKIPVPDTLDGEQCAVYREEADGTYTDMNAVYQNGYMVFTTDHFSVYILTTEESTSVSLGDVNGDGTIDAADAVMIQRYDSGLTTLTDEQLAAADVNADGLVDAADAVRIQRYDAGLIASL